MSTVTRKATVREIIVDYLTQNGFDGLYNQYDDCGCQIKELMPCCEPCGDCVPVVITRDRLRCEALGVDFEIGPEPESEK
jgi:hypothetical protein